jgi:uncharacterized protein (TIGR03437 family)
MFLAVPAIVLSFASGPPARHTGAPGENTCAECHTGSNNPTAGNIEVTFEGGNTYTPGQAKNITVRITQRQNVHGFQMSARQAASTGTQAGTFTAGSGMRVICGDDSPRQGTSCPSNNALEFIEHITPNPQGEWTFQWTAPSEAVGDVRFFVAANAANGNGANTGDRIYTANFTLTAAQGGGGQRPAISQGGVVDAFMRQTAFASASWIEIYGQNLAPTSRDWTGAINNNQLPTSLEGVSVMINNQPAAISYISSGQVNALIPASAATGDIQVVLRTPQGESAPATIRKTEFAPVPLAPVKQENRSFVRVVDNATGAILGKPGVDPAATRAVRPGDVIQLYALGLGPTNPALQTDRLQGTAALVNTPVVRINQTAAEVLGSALAGPGLYQFNLRAPDQNGDVPLVIEIGGARSAENVFITIQR